MVPATIISYKRDMGLFCGGMKKIIWKYREGKRVNRLLYEETLNKAKTLQRFGLYSVS